MDLAVSIAKHLFAEQGNVGGCCVRQMTGFLVTCQLKGTQLSYRGVRTAFRG